MNKYPTLEYDESSVKEMKPVEFSENDSYNLRFIKILRKKRQYRSFFSKAFGVTGAELDKLAINKAMTFFCLEKGTLLTWPQLFALRNILPPAGWFYKYNENLPELLKYNSKYNDFTPELYSKFSHGHIKLKELVNTHTFAGVSEMSKISIANLKNMFRLVKSNAGYVKFHTMPSIPIIENLKPYIDEQLWFIMEDEKIRK